MKILRPCPAIFTFFRGCLVLSMILLWFLFRIFFTPRGLFAVLLTLSTIFSTWGLCILLTAYLRSLEYQLYQSFLVRQAGILRRKRQVMKGNAVLYYTSVKPVLLGLAGCRHLFVFGYGIRLVLFGLRKQDCEQICRWLDDRLPDAGLKGEGGQ